MIDLKPDVALLQEVSSIPTDIEQSFDVKFHNAVTRNGTPQRFGTAILVKGTIVEPLPLSSEYGWVNQELNHTTNFTGQQTEFDAYQVGAGVSHEHGFGPNDTQRINDYIINHYQDDPNYLNNDYFPNNATFPQ